ncbi:MAG: tRNA uridine-5-carboxymethylaminomethyl(34) synthesis enzyme MnmG [Halobacteriovoraceae bacterium]|nr:tRNA uridine-5-carboxymethylaminomethyl(34) synthesis enzyme MnmG [Halobacteriovoraceae bacterium]|tara:strand:+ start:74 stop:1900 length:1827 start_codon:yes stop_codon:yes gene_type:complete
MFDIAIIGGGHAGLEAAHIASQFHGIKVALITIPGVGLASAPCNPAIGGVGKGQVVRELDALGGIMPKLADLAGIQFRTLNESKGYAVQSSRIQIDKDIYSEQAEKLAHEIENLTIIKEKIISIAENAQGFQLSSNCSTWNTKKLILTVGTFLKGKMHTGDEVTSGGRVGIENSEMELFAKIKKTPKRFKTGTPARIYADSIDYSKLEIQPSDDQVNTFHVLHGTNQRFLTQKNCYLAYTNENTMGVIRDNKEKSPMFNGQIKAIGARYCPSIEDKAYRYPDKNKHHVFIEPEGLKRKTMYPSGVSSSLPKDVQKDFLRNIEGLEAVEIETYGYAVEYDVIDTTRLYKTLEHKDLSHLYFAGQINGTSGYEEAAAQGFIAGVNAALSVLKRDEFIVSRNDSYIGVLIEDLVSNTRDEPYRLFTARSENRLYIREDNSINRMIKYREKLGLNLPIDQYSKKFVRDFEKYWDLLKNTFVGQDDYLIQSLGLVVPRRTSLSEIIKRADLNPIQTLQRLFITMGLLVDSRLVNSLAISLKYEGYISKATEQYQRVNKVADKKLDFQRLMNSENISFECKQRIKNIEPDTFAQLKLIEGIRPATLAVVASDSY